MAVVDDAWGRHRQWSRVAEDTKESLERWRSRNLALIIAGATCGALAAQSTWYPATVTTTFGVLGAAALAVAGFVQTKLLGPKQLETWAQARAASESLKGLVYHYLAGVAPYVNPNGDKALADKMRAVQERAKSLVQLMVAAESDGKPPPALSGTADYVTMRADNQANWHAKRVKKHQDLARRWRRAELLATAAAALLAAVGGALHGPDLSAWVAVATTVGAAFAAHLASAQHDRIAASYALTAEELQDLIRDFDPATATADEAARFVADVERVLAVQNESWASLVSQG